ncbi:MAG: outer membrane protein assembly factor BamA [Bdellovibrionales bacterium]
MKRLFVGLILTLLCADAVAQARPAANSAKKATSAAVIGKIQIKGQKKIEADAIRSKLTSKEGQPFSDAAIRQDVLDLFNLGYFYDVQVDREDQGGKVNLTYLVTEKPSIAEIHYNGNEELTDDEIKEAAGLKAYELLDQTKLTEAVEKIEKTYEDKGFFLAKVSTKAVPAASADQVIVHVNVQENDKVKVKRITFLGNSRVPSGKLKGAMLTQEGGFFSFLSGSGAYKQEAFDRDVQMLNFLYFNEGYVQVKVDRPQVYVTPDKTGIYITIKIEEGEQFQVGTVDFAGDLLFSNQELLETAQIDESGLFRYETLQSDLRDVQAKYGDLGYAFANVIPRTRVREQDKEVDITFEIDKGNKVYIGRINMLGNTKTRDKVIRRELRIREGELYNETRKRESFDNVKRLGYFDEVNFNVKTPKGKNDVIDYDIVVKERNTGTIQVGAGYSSYQKFVLNGQVNQINLSGKGQKLGASVDISKAQSLFKLSFTEPYFNDTEWSTGYDIYQSKRQLSEYSETKKGGAVRIGHPLAPYLDGFIRYKLDDTDLRLTDLGDPDLFPVNTANGITSSATFTLEYDKRDDRFTPSKGLYSSVSLEYAGLGGDKKYTKGYANLRYYKKAFWDVVWRNNIAYGFISSNDPSKPPPFNELFLLGGANSLRGYDWFSIGRRKFSNRAYNAAFAQGLTGEAQYNAALRPFGGTQQFYYNLEFQFPMIDEAGIKGVVFYDIGDADNQLKLTNFRSDVGFGFRWFSPIGPLRFEWGFPIDRQDRFNEGAVNFQFAIGAPF